MPVTDYFSVDYASARERFRATATGAGASLDAYELPNRRGLNDETLAIDVASLRMEGAERVLVLVSGTHGVEGFCGSAAQIALLHDRPLHALLERLNVAILVVHAINPYGDASQILLFASSTNMPTNELIMNTLKCAKLISSRMP